MFENPLRLADGGLIRLVPGKAMEAGHHLGAVRTKLERAADAAPQERRRGVDVVRAGKRVDHPLAISRLLTEGARLQKRGDQAQMFTGVGLREITANHQHLLRVTGRELRADSRTPAIAGFHRDRIPRLTHAVAVEIAGLQVHEHRRRRHHDDVNVLVRIDARRRKPRAQQEVVGGPLEDHAEGKRLRSPATFDLRAQRPRIPHAALAQVAGKRDGVAVEIQHQPCHAFAANRAQRQRRREGHHRERMGCFQVAVENLVANGRPARLALKLHIEIIFGKETQLLRHHQRSAINKGDKTNAENF